MKSGKINTYLNDRLTHLLNEHGPKDEGERGLADKLNYIIPAWHEIMREEKARLTSLLSPAEWICVQACTISHSFAMEDGGAMEADLGGSVLACVEDTLDSELAMDDASAVQASTITKLQGLSNAQQLALVWMLIRARRRM